MLRVSAIGNLGKEPEERYTAKGSQIVQFSLAVNKVKTNADGERQESTEWFRVRVMGRQTEFASRLEKGQRVLVIGSLDISHWRDRDTNAERTGYDIWADEIQAMAKRERTDEAPQESTKREAPAGRPASAPAEDDDTDLPF